MSTGPASARDSDPNSAPRQLRRWIALVPTAAGAAVLAVARIGNPVFAILGVIAICFAVLLLVVVWKASTTVEKARDPFWRWLAKAMVIYVLGYAATISVIALIPMGKYILALSGNVDSNAKVSPSEQLPAEVTSAGHEGAVRYTAEQEKGERSETRPDAESRARKNEYELTAPAAWIPVDDRHLPQFRTLDITGAFDEVASVYHTRSLDGAQVLVGTATPRMTQRLASGTVPRRLSHVPESSARAEWLSAFDAMFTDPDVSPTEILEKFSFKSGWGQPILIRPRNLILLIREKEVWATFLGSSKDVVVLYHDSSNNAAFSHVVEFVKFLRSFRFNETQGLLEASRAQLESDLRQIHSALNGGDFTLAAKLAERVRPTPERLAKLGRSDYKVEKAGTEFRQKYAKDDLTLAKFVSFACNAPALKVDVEDLAKYGRGEDPDWFLSVHRELRFDLEQHVFYEVKPLGECAASAPNASLLFVADDDGWMVVPPN